MQKTTSILQMFPQKLRLYFEQAAEHEDLAEIRIRCRQPVMLRRGRKEYYLAADGTMQEERPEECLVFEDVPPTPMGKNSGRDSLQWREDTGSVYRDRYCRKIKASAASGTSAF